MTEPFTPDPYPGDTSSEVLAEWTIRQMHRLSEYSRELRAELEGVESRLVVLETAEPVPEPEPEPEPEPQPPTYPPPQDGDDIPDEELPTTDCGALPSNVTVVALDIYRNVQTTESLGEEIKSFRFTTNSSTTAYGALTLAYTTTNPTTKTCWISECPGDISVVTDPATSTRCVDSGYEVAQIQWTQDPNIPHRCVLEPNKTYYFNVKNAHERNMTGTSCPDGLHCPFYFQRSFADPG